MNNDISDKHKVFIDQYFNNKLNATKAYQSVYTKATDSSAQKQSSQLLKKLEKTSYFLKKKEEKEKERQDTYKLNLTRLKELFEDSIKGDPIYGEDGRILGYKKDRRTALGIINEINKMEGNHAEQRIKLSGDSNAPLFPSSLEIKFE